MDVAHGHLARYIDLFDHPRACSLNVAAGPSNVGDLENDHIAAVAVAFFQQTTRRGAGRLGRHHLKECVAYRPDSVLQAELSDTRVGIGCAKTQDSDDISCGGLKVLADQGDLSEAHVRYLLNEIVVHHD